MTYDTYLFTCAICGREVRDFPDRNGRDRHLAPICLYHESEHRGRRPTGGAFMDRRKAVQIYALAEELQAEAYHLKWKAEHAIS